VINSPRDLVHSNDAVPCGRCGTRTEPPRYVGERGKGSRVVYVVICALCEDAFLRGAWGQAEFYRCQSWSFSPKKRGNGRKKK
jgi:hypothetical protein